MRLNGIDIGEGNGRAAYDVGLDTEGNVMNAAGVTPGLGQPRTGEPMRAVAAEQIVVARLASDNERKVTDGR